MSILTFSELQVAVRNWLHRLSILGADDTIDVVPDLIVLGERRLFRDCRHRVMEQPLSAVIADGVIPVPSDYVSLRNAYVDGNPISPLQRRKVEYIYTRFPLRSCDSMPSVIAREGGNFIFGPFPDALYTIKGIYYRRLNPIATELNALYSEAPDLYLFAALLEARVFMEDDTTQIALIEQKYQAILNAVNNEEKEEDFSGSAPTMKSEIHINDRMRAR